MEAPAIEWRSDERNTFLTDLLCMAVEHGGYGWFLTSDYQHDVPLGLACATVHAMDEEDETYRVTLEVIVCGLDAIKGAELRDSGADGPVLHNVKTGERLFLATSARERIMDADRENDAGQLDVIDALAVLECGLFGRVMYA